MATREEMQEEIDKLKAELQITRERIFYLEQLTNQLLDKDNYSNAQNAWSNKNYIPQGYPNNTPVDELNYSSGISSINQIDWSNKNYMAQGYPNNAHINELNHSSEMSNDAPRAWSGQNYVPQEYPNDANVHELNYTGEISDNAQKGWSNKNYVSQGNSNVASTDELNHAAKKKKRRRAGKWVKARKKSGEFRRQRKLEILARVETKLISNLTSVHNFVSGTYKSPFTPYHTYNNKNKKFYNKINQGQNNDYQKEISNNRNDQ